MSLSPDNRNTILDASYMVQVVSNVLRDALWDYNHGCSVLQNSPSDVETFRARHEQQLNASLSSVCDRLRRQFSDYMIRLDRVDLGVRLNVNGPGKTGVTSNIGLQGNVIYFNAFQYGVQSRTFPVWEAPVDIHPYQLNNLIRPLL